MEKIDVSVIVPVYNAKNYIEQCLDSLGKQTLKNMEIIVIDDGSNDGSSELIDAISKRYDNMRVLHQENKGLFVTRAIGLSLARGFYIGWVDADDFVDFEMYERLWKTAQNTDADCVICDYEFYPQKVKQKEKWFKPYEGKVDWNFIERNTQPWNKLVKKELLLKVNGIEKWAEEGDGIYVNVIIKAEKIITISDKLYYYRVGHDSMSGGSFKNKVNHYMHVVEIAENQKQYIVGTKYERELKEYFEYRYIYSLIQLLVVSSYNDDYTVYNKTKSMLEKIRYNGNRYTAKVMNCNYGIVKSIVLRRIIPTSFFVAKTVMKFIDSYVKR